VVSDFRKFLATDGAKWARYNLPPDLARIYLTSDKIVRREYVRSLLPELKYADILVSYAPVEEALDTIMSAGEGFIKPINGRNSIGCFPLKREGDKLVAPVIGGKTVEEWASYLTNAIAKVRGIKPFWIVEEVLDIKVEVKVHVFAPRAVNAILIRREWVEGGHPIRHVIEIDRDGNVIDTISPKTRFSPHNRDLVENRLTVEDIPANIGDYIDLADKFGRLISFPFIRLDMYDTDDGIYYSEMTRLPLMFRYIRSEVTDMYLSQWKASVEFLRRESGV